MVLDSPVKVMKIEIIEEINKKLKMKMKKLELKVKEGYMK